VVDLDVCWLELSVPRLDQTVGRQIAGQMVDFVLNLNHLKSMPKN